MQIDVHGPLRDSRLGLGNRLIGPRGPAVPQRLADLDLHAVLILAQAGNLNSLSGKQSGHLFGESGHVGLPGSLPRKRDLRQPGPAGVRQGITGRAADQVVLPDLGIVLARQAPAVVERDLRPGPRGRQQGAAENRKAFHGQWMFRRRRITSMCSARRRAKKVSRSAARSPSSGPISG